MDQGTDAARAFESLAPVPAQTLGRRVFAQLREGIISGAIPPGTQLNETRLAKRFGVSRGPLREAIRTLIELGLATSRPYAGTFVIDLGAHRIRELYSARLALETRAFRLLWEQRDAAYRAEFERRYDALIAAIKDDDPHREIAGELAFHSFPFECAGNAYLLQFWSQLKDHLRLCFSLIVRRHGFAFTRMAHESYLAAATGESLETMLDEVEAHLAKGTGRLLRQFDRREARQDA